MLRLVAALLTAATPALAATPTGAPARGALNIGVVITSTASGLKTTRYAAAASARQAPSRTFVTCDEATCVKTIYY